METININISLTRDTTYIGVEDSSGAEYSTQEFTPQEAFNDYMENYVPNFFSLEPFMYEGIRGPVEVISFSRTDKQTFFLDIDDRVIFSIETNDANKEYTFNDFAEVFGLPYE